MNYNSQSLQYQLWNISQNNLPVFFATQELNLPNGTENLIQNAIFHLVCGIQNPSNWTPFRVYLFNQMAQNNYRNSEFATFVRNVCALAIAKNASNFQLLCTQAIASKAAWNAQAVPNLQQHINGNNQASIIEAFNLWQEALQTVAAFDQMQQQQFQQQQFPYQQQMQQNNGGGVRSNFTNQNNFGSGYNGAGTNAVFNPNAISSNSGYVQPQVVNNNVQAPNNSNSLGYGSWTNQQNQQQPISNEVEVEVVSSAIVKGSDMSEIEPFANLLNPSKAIDLPVSKYSFIKNPSIVYSPKYGQGIVKVNDIVTKFIKGDNMDIQRHLNSLHDIKTIAPVAGDERVIAVSQDPDMTLKSIKVENNKEMVIVSLQGVEFKVTKPIKEAIPLVTSTSELEPGFNSACYKSGLFGTYSSAAIGSHVTMVKKDHYNKIKEILAQGTMKYTLVQWRGIISELKAIDLDVFTFINDALTKYVNEWTLRRGVVLTIDDFCDDLLDLDTMLRKRIDVDLGKSNYDDFYLGIHSLPIKFQDHDSNIYVAFCSDYSVISDENLSVDESIDDIPVVFTECLDILYLNINSKKLDINYEGKIGFLMATTTPVLYHVLHALVQPNKTITLITSDRVKYHCCESPYNSETILINKVN